MIITDKTKEVMAAACARALFTSGITTEEELWFVATEIFGMKIPRETCCEEHQPMWGAIVDDFFHRVPRLALRHCRGGGKTAGVALSKALKIVGHPGIRISNFAATEAQGYALFGYVNAMLGPGAHKEVRRLMEKVEGSVALSKERPVPGRSKPAKSKMRVITGTMKGVNSEHVDDLVQDERAQMEDKVANESVGMMTAAEPYPGMLTVLSTVKAKGDGMDTLLDNADELGYKTYVSCILDVTNCQETNCKGCQNTWTYSLDKLRRKNFYDFCQGRLLGRNLGHFSLETARNKFTGMGLENATAQLFCRAPEGTEIAFPGFTHTNNVRKLNPPREGFFVFGDFGKSDYSWFLKAYHLDDHDPARIYVEQELIGTGRTIQEWIPILKAEGFDQALAWLVDVAGRQTTITSKTSAIDYMVAEGWQVMSEKMDETETTERLRTLVDDGRFIIHPSCKKTIECFERSTNKPVGTGDNVTFLKVIKHNKFSHGIDSARYGSFLLMPDDLGELVGSYRIR